MRLFRHASIKQKQVLLILGICGLVLLLSGGAFMLEDWSCTRSGLASQLLLRGDILARASGRTLDLWDPTAAKESLAVMKADPHTVSAVFFTADKKIFAGYFRDGSTTTHPQLHGTGKTSAFAAGRLWVVQPILRHGDLLGFIQLESDLGELQVAMAHDATVLLLTLAAAFVLAMLLSSRLQRVLSDPVLDLLRTIQAVTSDKNYVPRARKQSQDELGQLADGFNAMLAEIQARDATLRTAHDGLEQRVQERTRELEREMFERQRTGEMLKESLGEMTAYKSLLDQACSLYTTDPRGVITQVNDVCCRLSGYQREELIGQHHRILASGAHPDAFHRKMWSTITAGGVWRGEIENRHKDGQTYWVDATLGPILDPVGGTIGYLAIRTDITARRKQERELLHAQAFLDSVIENLPIPVFIKEADQLRFVRWNKAGEDLTGIANEEMVGKNDFDFFPAADAEKFTALDRQVLASGEKLDIPEEILQTRRLGARTVHVTKVPVLDPEGRPTHLLGIAMDITDRKRVEAEMAGMTKRLLETSRQAGMAEVATGVLHNVGNVLNSVNVSATLLGDRLRKGKTAGFAKVAALVCEHTADLPGFFSRDPRAGGLPGYLEQFARHLATEQAAMLGEVENLRKNIDHIKDIVSMQQSYAQVSGLIEKVKPAELVEDTLRMNAGSLDRHAVEVVKELDDLPAIEMDKHKALQILVNFVCNAKHACDESGRSDKRIVLRLQRHDDRARFSVSDNGAGIAAENRARIFNHGFTTRKEGHGFGLHSAANAAQEMGGSVAFHSDGLGLGATFILELPLATIPGDQNGPVPGQKPPTSPVAA